MIMKISLDSIEVDGRTQHRNETNYGHIENIRDSILDGNKIAPISVIEATDIGNQKYYLIDGFHRVEAHYAANQLKIFAQVETQGNIDDAIYMSLSANAEHEPALSRLRPDIVNAAGVATKMIFIQKQCINKDSFDFNPYPKVEIDEVIDAVKCTKEFARKACSLFNKNIKEKRDKSIYKEFTSGRTYIEIANNHNVSVSTVKSVINKIVERNHYESSRESGYKRKRDKNYKDTDAESGYKGKPKFTHRVSEPDFKVESDLTAYLLSGHFLGGNKNKTEQICVTGRIDIITDDEIIEVKRILNRQNIYSAIGQLMLYKSSFKQMKLTIAGMFHKDLDSLGEHIGNIGIDVILIHSNGDIERYIKGIANGI